MSTAARLTFSEIPSNQRILFSNAQAWNNWFNDISISIASDNLPNATTDDIGCVKMATLTTTFTYVSYTPTYIELQDLAGSITKVPSNADFDAINTQVKQIATTLTALIDALKLSGVISNNV